MASPTNGRLYRRTRHSRQEVSACLHPKWDLMPFGCPTPSARRSVPAWMCPALEDATGDSWHAAWVSTGAPFLLCLDFWRSFLFAKISRFNSMFFLNRKIQFISHIMTIQSLDLFIPSKCDSWTSFKAHSSVIVTQLKKQTGHTRIVLWELSRSTMECYFIGQFFTERLM